MSGRVKLALFDEPPDRQKVSSEGVMSRQTDQTLRRTKEFSGFLIVRLDRNIQPAEAKTLREFARLRDLRGLEDVLLSLGQPQTKRAVWSLPIDEILRLVDAPADLALAAFAGACGGTVAVQADGGIRIRVIGHGD